MRPRRVLLPCAALLLAAAALPAASQASSPGPLEVLSANVLPGLARTSVADLGAAPVDQRMVAVVALNRPDTAGEDAYLKGEYDKGSPLFHHFLTPAEVAQRWSVAPAVQAQARQWLTGAGLTIDATSATGDIIDVHGPVSAVQTAFGVSIHRFTQTLSGTVTSFLANTAAPSVPAALNVMSVVGLNTFQHFTVAGHTTVPAQDTCTAGLCLGATTVSDLQQVYDQPKEYTGAGQTIGVFGEGDTAAVIKDLRVFEQKNKLPTTPVTTIVAPGDTTLVDDPGGDGEWRIDTQAEKGMAPDLAGMRLYFSDNTFLPDSEVLKSFTQWQSDPLGPNQMDASFGECEALPAGISPALTSVANPLTVPLPVDVPLVGGSVLAGQGLGNSLEGPGDAVLKLATIEGRTLFSSTGDTGSSCPVVVASVIGAGNGLANQGVPLTSYPASSPYVVGVGGTVLYTNQPASSAAAVTRGKEYAWTFGGGGDTFFIAEPSWQVGFPTLPCVTTADGTPDPQDTCRGIPDVAAQSGDAVTNGFLIYSGGDASQGGGTSLSSPLWTGMWARVASAAPQGRTGFAAPAIYGPQKDATAYTRDFFDVNSLDTSGSIPAANGLYAALPGWDYATGLGTPRVDGLICDVDKAGSGRFAASGVAGVCPKFSAKAGTPAPVVTKPVKKPTKKPVKTPTVKAATGALAATGLGVGIPLAAVALVGVALGLRRRRA